MDKYLTTKELALRWRISEKTVVAWRAKGTGPDYFQPHGTGNVLYALEDIKRFEDHNTIIGSSK